MCGAQSAADARRRLQLRSLDHHTDDLAARSARYRRDFTYPKPRVVATWTPNADDQWRASFLRDVSQLDFGDFATGLNSISSQANVGNTQLLPEQTWKASLQWKRALGPRGSISLTGFYDDIQDTQDFILVAGACTTPAGTPGQCTAVGNVGDGKRWRQDRSDVAA